MNLVILIGRLGHDAEVKEVSSGKKVCNFSVATEERIKRGSGFEKLTVWHRIVAWELLAEHAGTLKKGELVMIEGTLRVDKWRDKSGNDREGVQVLCQRLRTLDGRDS